MIKFSHRKIAKPAKANMKINLCVIAACILGLSACGQKDSPNTTKAETSTNAHGADDKAQMEVTLKFPFTKCKVPSANETKELEFGLSGCYTQGGANYFLLGGGSPSTSDNIEQAERYRYDACLSDIKPWARNGGFLFSEADIDRCKSKDEQKQIDAKKDAAKTQVQPITSPIDKAMTPIPTSHTGPGDGVYHDGEKEGAEFAFTADGNQYWTRAKSNGKPNDPAIDKAIAERSVLCVHGILTGKNVDYTYDFVSAGPCK